MVVTFVEVPASLHKNSPTTTILLAFMEKLQVYYLWYAFFICLLEFTGGGTSFKMSEPERQGDPTMKTTTLLSTQFPTSAATKKQIILQVLTMKKNLKYY